jgi:hypothetical protein
MIAMNELWIICKDAIILLSDKYLKQRQTLEALMALRKKTGRGTGIIIFLFSIVVLAGAYFFVQGYGISEKPTISDQEQVEQAPADTNKTNKI